MLQILTRVTHGAYYRHDMGKMTATQCCPGFSYLNVGESSVQLLSIAIMVLPFAMDYQKVS
eukprot:11361035-Ditylum_brightwellii.AAC.1